jgi:hypothetical protein
LLASTPFDSNILVNDKNKKKMKFNGKRSVLLLPGVDLTFVKQLKDVASNTSKTTVRSSFIVLPPMFVHFDIYIYILFSLYERLGEYFEYFASHLFDMMYTHQHTLLTHVFN